MRKPERATAFTYFNKFYTKRNIELIRKDLLYYTSVQFLTKGLYTFTPRGLDKSSDTHHVSMSN